ncbi:Fe(3+)-hydroxamate ABC transporter permease FhuB [Leisingera sp. ANG-Vp]|uniref:Fe(3+)-hydroxamate ABC transporter permease FhuB n=1 Tax=Leisingera sp. ANG-Vp TaxID=1577896 RepID=UPI00057D28CF|nr:Fe(3+)-hydroxamate ABC transporter permease FhuB [Leisingera sp. ANG-Vp]KIC20347.1 hypothetical protein RA20_09025 [Leisingera sp. ANG-Vp]
MIRAPVQTALPAAAMLLAAIAHLWANGAGDADWLALLAGAAPGLEEILLLSSAVPRVAMALLVGAAMGLSGAILQEVTQNRLVAPTTLGTASGAWLALVAAAALAPAFLAAHMMLVAMSGALAASALVLLVAGLRNMAGLSLIIAGMCANLLFGGIGLTLLLLDIEGAQQLFIWSAGDLTQTGWEQARWLAPQLGLAAAGALLLGRGIALMRLGAAQAQSKGLSVVPLMAAAVVLAVWMTAASITAVGVIGFVGVLAPNIARALGVRRVLPLLAASAATGALSLLAADILPVALSDWSKELIPSGSATALLGAPAFVILAYGQRGRLVLAAAQPETLRRGTGALVPLLILAGLAAACLAALFVSRSIFGLELGTGDRLGFDFRWPRVVLAMAAGLAMAVSGVVLQRLLKNPLASPDIVGVTSGSALAVVFAVIFLGLPFESAALPAAIGGGLLVGGLLIALNRPPFGAPQLMILLGISVGAALDAVMQFVLAKGGDEGYPLLPWLAGTTARADGFQALALLAIALAGLAAALMGSRVLNLLVLGEPAAETRGLPVRLAVAAWLTLSAGLAAAVTAFAGPISFVGLLAPHIARMLGAQDAARHLLVAGLAGALVMVVSDHLGRILLFPQTLPAGAVATVAGGGYLFYLLVRQRKK